MPGPRRAQAMVNKEEKTYQTMNLETNGNMYAERSERLTEKQTIETEATENINQWDREHYLRQHQPWGQ